MRNKICKVKNLNSTLEHPCAIWICKMVTTMQDTLIMKSMVKVFVCTVPLQVHSVKVSHPEETLCGFSSHAFVLWVNYLTVCKNTSSSTNKCNWILRKTWGILVGVCQRTLLVVVFLLPVPQPFPFSLQFSWRLDLYYCFFYLILSVQDRLRRLVRWVGEGQ